MVNKYDCIIPQTCSLFAIYIPIILVYFVECVCANFAKAKELGDEVVDGLIQKYCK